MLYKLIIKWKNVDRRNEMDNLLFSSRNARFADSSSDNSQSVETSLISFCFTHPSKFIIAIKCCERRGLHSMNQKRKGNGHWPGAIHRGWPVWRRRCKERDETHACHDGRSIFSWCSNAIPKTISQTVYAKLEARARLWRIDRRGRLRKEERAAGESFASRSLYFNVERR